MDIRALAFDTGGKVLDWHGGLVAAFSGTGSSRGFELDWHAVANDWRRRSMKGIVGQVQPAFNMDDVHRRTLDETIEHFGLHTITLQERDRVWRAWHQLDARSDFPRAQAALRKAFPVAHQAGFHTAFVRRPDEWGPDEWGPDGPPDPRPNMEYDFIDDGFEALQRELSADSRSNSR